MSVKAILNVLIYSNTWISLGAVCFSLLFARFCQVIIPDNFLLFIFFSTLFTYNFQRIVKLNYTSHAVSGPRFNWLKKNQNIVILLTIIALIASIFFGFNYFLQNWILLAIIGFISLFYVWKLPFSVYNLRNLHYLKFYLIALTWVLTTIVLPNYLFNDNRLSLTIILFMLGAFLFMLAITIPFDIRDVIIDEKEKRTIPQLLGVKKSKYLAIILYLAGHFLWLIAFRNLHYGLILHFILGATLIFYVEIKRKDNYFSVAIDGLLISILCFYFIN